MLRLLSSANLKSHLIRASEASVVSVLLVLAQVVLAVLVLLVLALPEDNFFCQLEI